MVMTRERGRGCHQQRRAGQHREHDPSHREYLPVVASTP
jgi:hypothetical protein